MTRFNNKATANVTSNHEGEKAYRMTPELELYTLVVTSMFSDKFYESADGRLDRLRNLITQVDPVFVAKLAVYAREQMYLRTMPLILVVELAKVHNGDNLVRKTLQRVVKRADEITETLAYYQLANTRKGTKKLGSLSTQIRLGLGDAFNKFDEYQFAKYNRPGEIKLKDALFVVHPKPISDEQQALFDKIERDELETPYTWETELSAKGNNAEVWTELIGSGRLGYMALLRNLRNILDAEVDTEAVKALVGQLTHPEAVRRSKQLPFRFLSAFRELKENSNPHTPMVLNAIEDAIMTSIENVKGFDTNVTVAVACDVSRSMFSNISPRSKVMQFDIGLLLGMLLQSRCKMVTSGMFGDTFKIVNLPQSSVLQNVEDMRSREGEVGYSTNGYKVLDGLKANKVKADKIMIFTDCQMWNSDEIWGHDRHIQKSWNEYKKFHPEAKLYLFDLSGYGTSPVSLHSGDVYTIAGWSDKVFDVLDAYDKGNDAISFIEEVEV
jgi:60 kDa SS-A/Ro ribonucleoprotein